MKHAKRIAMLSFLTAVAACGGGSDKSCVELCTEAQAGDCTGITGSCSSFCSSLDAVQGPAGCTSQNDTYQGCLNDGASACSGTCRAEETQLSNCVIAYCSSRTTDTNCQVLIQSF